jgi:hypothetical protein
MFFIAYQLQKARILPLRKLRDISADDIPEF